MKWSESASALDCFDALPTPFSRIAADQIDPALRALASNAAARRLLLEPFDIFPERIQRLPMRWLMLARLPVRPKGFMRRRKRRAGIGTTFAARARPFWEILANCPTSLKQR
jgi:hypothetical protein